MKILHFCAGLQFWNGMANTARQFVEEETAQGHESSVTDCPDGIVSGIDVVYIHGAWLPVLWKVAKRAKSVGAKLIIRPAGSYDPVRLAYHSWKKRLVAYFERKMLRRADVLLATCKAEAGWIGDYAGKRCPKVEITDLKRFFDLGDRSQALGVGEDFSRKERKDRKEDEGNGSKQETGKKKLNLLYLGRRHPLKGVEFLEAAVAELGGDSRSRESKSNSGIDDFCREKNLSGNCSTSTLNSDSKQIELRIVSNAFGEEKEKVWDWCDVLVLPTLSENFGRVVAEALERGNRVITTDGAPAWEPGVSGQGLGVSVEVEDREDSSTSTLNFDSNILVGYGGRLLYLKGYRDGTRGKRVELLKKAIEGVRLR